MSHNTRRAVNSKDHPLSTDLAKLLAAIVAYNRRIVSFQGNPRFKQQLLTRLIGGLAHCQSLTSMLAAGEGMTEEDIMKATAIGDALMDDAIKLAQDRQAAQLGHVRARPIGKASPGQASGPAPLVTVTPGAEPEK